MSSRERIYREGLDRIARGDVCMSYEYDPTPTEREIACSAIRKADLLLNDSFGIDAREEELQERLRFAAEQKEREVEELSKEIDVLNFRLAARDAELGSLENQSLLLFEENLELRVQLEAASSLNLDLQARIRRLEER